MKRKLEKETLSLQESPARVVTSINVQKKNPSRRAVFVDGEFSFGVHGDVVMALGIRKGSVITGDLIERAVMMDAEYRARRAALELLSYRSRSEAELGKKLADKGFEADTVRSVVSDLVDRGLLDDNAFATEFVAQRVKSKGHGAVRLRSDLIRRGVNAEVVERALLKIRDDVDWKSTALKVASRKWDGMPKHLEITRRRKRLHDHLARRGFDFGLIREVVDEVTDRGC